jgi:serine/threonine-protein kinase
VYLEHPDDPRVGTTIDKYRVMGPLGTGGMGTVYRAQHVFIGKDVALKILKKEFQSHDQLVRRFLMEARAASMIHHPNIVDVTDFGVTVDGCSYCAMEYLEGPNLAEVMELQGAIPLYRIVNILTQACRALAAAHAVEIVHRDLKPENLVLLQKEGRRQIVKMPITENEDWAIEREPAWDSVKILDFGVAQVQQVTATLDQQTKSEGIVFGSPDYISPEQALGKNADHRSDIYSLGIIFYEMLTGEVPFQGDTAREVMTHHVRTPPTPPSRLRPDLSIPLEADELALRALAKKPEQRLQSMDEFISALRHCHGPTMYRRDLKDALRKFRRTGRRVPIPSELDPDPGKQELRREMKALFSESREPFVVPEGVVSDEKDMVDPSEELRRLLREDLQDPDDTK